METPPQHIPPNEGEEQEPNQGEEVEPNPEPDEPGEHHESDDNGDA